MPSKNSLNSLKPVSNDSKPILGGDTAKPKTKALTKKVKRINKGFQVEENRTYKWDLLLAKQKREGQTGPKLIDEALDYLFEKYGIKD